MSDDVIWIVDEVTTKAGMGEAFLKPYRQYYMPGAQSRGMTLAHELVEPAMWLTDEPNRLVFLWAVSGPGEVWASKHLARGDAGVYRWWSEEAPALIQSHRRKHS